MKCPKCGGEMKFIRTVQSKRTGRPADLYQCGKDQLVLSVEKEA